MEEAVDANIVINSRDGSQEGQDRENSPAILATQQPAPPNQPTAPASCQAQETVPTNQQSPTLPTNQTALDNAQNNMTESVNEQDLPEDSAENTASAAIMSEEVDNALDQNQRSATELDQGELQVPPVREIEKSNVPSQPG